MKNYQKKSNGITVATILFIAVFVFGGIYFLSRGSGAVANGTTTVSNINDLIGKPAPQFSLKDVNGTTYTNDSLKGKDVVLFFNEGIMCYPACWNQMAALPQLDSSDTVALSVVIDQPAAWANAIQKMPQLASATVLFDTDKAVSNEYGMLTVNSSMHYGSYPGHTFVVIDRKGIVRWVFDDPNMGVDNGRISNELATLQ